MKTMYYVGIVAKDGNLREELLEVKIGEALPLELFSRYYRVYPLSSKKSAEAVVKDGNNKYAKENIFLPYGEY